MESILCVHHVDCTWTTRIREDLTHLHFTFISCTRKELLEGAFFLIFCDKDSDKLRHCPCGKFSHSDRAKQFAPHVFIAHPKETLVGRPGDDRKHQGNGIIAEVEEIYPIDDLSFVDSDQSHASSRNMVALTLESHNLCKPIETTTEMTIDAAASLLARANEEKMMKTSKGQKERDTVSMKKKVETPKKDSSPTEMNTAKEPEEGKQFGKTNPKRLPNARIQQISMFNLNSDYIDSVEEERTARED
ncbi:hypothetical protein PRIPAC_84177 [Pristionchus pacificus]|uniref:Uncharacterized protein n=1 Tax=Pristionchus pacificus TaxID=54126 RepID=A0A2A6C9W6_PRIPA|nr:hypothetical protein PRIPAC_84177 [Pristionchus pacificus]|eukprot:PDM74868.1 hypothetical protein PRIPAC_43358 [Pristionchus pacificus]